MIEINAVSKNFAATTALSQISFQVRKGEVLGFLGPNGAGKTTTMKLITGFWQPDSGQILIDGLDVVTHANQSKRKIGYLPETVPLYDEMKVYEYLQFIASVRDILPDKILPRIKEVVEICNLHTVIGKSLDELSKGYRQRVGLAQAIMHDPDILILDEPTTGLDPNQIAEIRELIKKIGKEKTVIFSTHILAEAQATCDRVIIINKGRIVAEGTPQQLTERLASQETIHLTLKAPRADFLSVLQSCPDIIKTEILSEENGLLSAVLETKGGSDPLVLAELLLASRWPVCELVKTRASLEEVFRELTK
ncbi:MAG TPA: ATP-binding cassette domain-containing protein [bacterium]|nr:ATP-binding cassette domain-containing protein [bacterium]